MKWKSIETEMFLNEKTKTEQLRNSKISIILSSISKKSVSVIVLMPDWKWKSICIGDQHFEEETIIEIDDDDTNASIPSDMGMNEWIKWKGL